MIKQNKDGWIRHRGGKCPVEAGVLVDVRYRDGEIRCGMRALVNSGAEKDNWIHEADRESSTADCDIMRYRLHKPAEQPVIEPAVLANVQAFNERAELRYDPCADGPLQWRDRITEIDASVEALEEERASLVQRLEAEGFRLIERAVKPVEDMSDWRNWKFGDLISVNGDEYATDGVFKVGNFDYDPDTTMPVYLNGSGWPEIECMKFHSRPSK